MHTDERQIFTDVFVEIFLSQESLFRYLCSI